MTAMEPLHVHIPYVRLRDFFEFIKKRKYDLEIYFPSTVLDQLERPDLEKLRESLDWNPALTLHAPFVDMSPGAIDPMVKSVTQLRFRQIMNVAAILKPRAAVFHAGYDRWRYSGRKDIWLDNSLDTWARVMDSASKTGMRVAVENVFDEDPEALSMLIEKVNSPDFGFCFDTGHFNIFSTVPMEQWFDNLGKRLVEIEWPGRVETLLKEVGLPPLPPYIRRPDEPGDRDRYQTVYARRQGAVAAPTAGLHFTPELLRALEELGIGRATVTLHVGPGTFRPVVVERVEDHSMEEEWYEVPAEAVRALARARASGGRIVAVGTTTVRALESAAGVWGSTGVAAGAVSPVSGWTDLTIVPPFRFRTVDAMVTNFHLPRSSLLLLVSAFAGTDRVPVHTAGDVVTNVEGTVIQGQATRS